MCVQCMAGAMAAGASATGMRTWVVHRFGHRLTPAVRRRGSLVLLVAGVLAAGLVGPTP